MERLRPSAVRYIRLGPGGAWLDRCLAEGVIELNLRAAPHDLAAAGQWKTIEQHLITEEGWCARAAQDAVAELTDFYTLGDDCVWITFGRERLWWAMAEPEVLPVLSPGRGARLRRVIGEWRDTDLDGSPLALAALAPEFVAPLSAGAAICPIERSARLIGRINGARDPLMVEAQEAFAKLSAIALALVERLNHTELQTLVELVFAHSGWRRCCALPGPHGSVDLVLERHTERALVVVQPRQGRCGLEGFLRQAREFHFDRLVLVGPQVRAPVSAYADPRAGVWGLEELVRRALDAGLYGWLVNRVG